MHSVRTLCVWRWLTVHVSLPSSLSGFPVNSLIFLEFSVSSAVFCILAYALLFYSLSVLTRAKGGVEHNEPQAHVANPEWMQEWVALYDTGETGLTKLDTTKVALSPTAMLPA